MTDTPVVPPQPKWRLVKRRVQARRWGFAAGVLALGVMAFIGFDLGAPRMPWYIAAAFAVYVVLLILQITWAVEAGRKAMALVPYLLVKVAIFYLALSYWDPIACALAKQLGWWAVGIGFGATLTEARVTLKPLLLDPQHVPRGDNLVLTFVVLTTVVVPVTMLYFVARTVVTHACAI